MHYTSKMINCSHSVYDVGRFIFVIGKLNVVDGFESCAYYMSCFLQVVEFLCVDVVEKLSFIHEVVTKLLLFGYCIFQHVCIIEK